LSIVLIQGILYSGNFPEIYSQGKTFPVSSIVPLTTTTTSSEIDSFIILLEGRGEEG
jgi:hypothetical protein